MGEEFDVGYFYSPSAASALEVKVLTKKYVFVKIKIVLILNTLLFILIGPH